MPAADRFHQLLRVRAFGPAADPGSPEAAVVAHLRARFGPGLVGVLLYGSYLRGARDTLLDVYVVVDGYAGALGSRFAAAWAWLLPPNVYHLSLPDGVRAKYGVVSRAQLERRVLLAVHPYFWARLAQPTRVLAARDGVAADRLRWVLASAVRTFVRRLSPMAGDWRDPADFWSRAFALTYRAELRSEGAGSRGQLHEHDPAYYSAALEAFGGPAGRAPQLAHRVGWALTVVLGKLLSVGRLVKGAFTFSDPLDYILWKVERHSGIRAEPTPLQRRHPLLFAWPLVWRLYRQGAFR